MSWVSVKFAGLGSEFVRQKVNITIYWVQKKVIFIIKMVNDRSFYKMPSIITDGVSRWQLNIAGIEGSQFVEISQVCKSLSRLNHSEMNVEVAIRLLGASNHLHKVLDCSVDIFLILFRQKIARAFDPFRNVRVPKKVIWNGPMGWRVAVTRVPLEFEGIVPPSLL